MVVRSNLITIIITVIVLLKERHQIGPGYIERASNLTDRRPHVSSPTKTRAKLQTWSWISLSSLALSLSLIVIEKSRHVWCIATCFIFCSSNFQLHQTYQLWCWSRSSSLSWCRWWWPCWQVNQGALHQICLNFKLFNFLIAKEKLEHHPKISRKSIAQKRKIFCRILAAPLHWRQEL